MNTTRTRPLPLRPDVAAFVDQVRDLLSDLPPEVQQELTEGLEADLTDQVTEGDGGALGDPATYAAELRAAAGLDPAVARRRPRTPAAQQLPRLRARWDHLVAQPRVAPVWSVVAALAPLWWAARGWAAAVGVGVMVPGWDGRHDLMIVPGVHWMLGVILLVAAVVGSALVGLGRAWPGSRPPGARGDGARMVLAGLNVLGVVAVLVAANQLEDIRWEEVQRAETRGYAWGSRPDGGGVLNQGHKVCNIAAYDAQGRPLTGVQLFDQGGRPLDLNCRGGNSRWEPWMLGDVARWNVVPLAYVEGWRDRPRWRRPEDAEVSFPVPDRATVPAVTHRLVQPDGRRAGNDRSRAAARDDRLRGSERPDGAGGR